MRQAFEKIKVNIDEQCYVTNSIRCFSLNDPTDAQYKTCRDLFTYKEIEAVSPDCVLLLGTAALKTLFPNYKSITQKRGQILKHPDYPKITFFATFHPSAILRDLNKERFFLADIQAFWNFVENGVPEKEAVKYLIGQTPKDIHKILEFLMTKKLLAFDIETTGLDPYADDFRITTISFSDAPYRSFVIPFDFSGELRISDVSLELLAELLEHPEIKKIAHNSVYDIKCLKAYSGIGVQGLYADTMIMPYLFDSSLKMQSLKDLAAGYTDLGHYEEELLAITGEKKITGETYKSVPFDVLAKYAAKDTDATFRIYETFKPYFDKDSRLKDLQELYNEVVYCLVDLELEGRVIDEHYS